ncbi:MAG: GGDEF domain-containing protein [Ilumatobacteraceae bacterium]
MTATLATAGPSPDCAPASDTSRAIDAARSVADSRQRRTHNLVNDRLSALVLGFGFIAVALVVAATAGVPDGATALRIALVAALLTAAYRVTFEAVGGDAVPAQPLLVAALFILPLPYVPLAMLIGVVSAWLIGRPPLSINDLSAEALAGWHTIGPVTVLALSGATPVSGAPWPWLIAALAAQFAVDTLVALVRCRALGIPAASIAHPLRWTYTVDTLLAPIGLTAVLATDHAVVALGLAATPVALLALLARDRAAHLEQAVTISAAYEHAHTLATTDPLTELANRRAWTEAIARAAITHAAEPTERPVTVLMADVDGLKAVNDRFGHDAGDHLIRAAATALRAAAPEAALVARLGGDEFGILVTGPCNAADLAAAVRRAVAEQPPICGTAVSISLGTASCPPLIDVEDAVATADRLIADDKATRGTGRH